MDDLDSDTTMSAFHSAMLCTGTLGSDHPVNFTLAQAHQAPEHFSMDYVAQSNQQPWNIFARQGNFTPHVAPTMPAFTTYRGQVVPSDCSTSIHDSGYQSLPPQPMPSAGPASVNGTADCHDADELLQDFHLNPTALAVDGPASPKPQISVDSRSSRSNTHPHRCDQCKATLKTKSELKKHIQRHTKPFMCSLITCKRGGQGFSTRNDLDRHMKTTHRQFDESKAYYCTHGCTDSRKRKPWPRADNFRQHLDRIHGIKLRPEDDLTRYQIYTSVPEETLDAQPSPTASDKVIGIDRSAADTDATIAGLSIVEMHESMQDMNHFVIDADPSMIASFLEQPEVRPLASGYTDPENLLTPNDDIQSIANQRLIEAGWDVDNWDEGLPMQHLNSSIPVPDAPDTQAQQNIGARANDSLGSYIKASKTPDSECRVSDSSLSKSSPVLRDVSDTQSDTVCSMSIDVTCVPDVELCPQDVVKKLEDQVPRDVLMKACEMILGNIKTPEDVELPPKEAIHTCGVCKKKFRRPCELKKHERRHVKPYWCTSYDCSARFGSKNDWKRHERGQHLHLDQRVCGIGGCRVSCTCKADLKRHMIEQHNIQDEKLIQEQLREDRPDIHNDQSFWCGFCQRYKKVTEPDKNTWLVRFDHIDDHICGRNNLPTQSMKDWVYVEEMHERRMRLSERKRKQDRALEPSSDSWQCCRCSEPVWNGITFDASCLSCSHPRCPTCEVAQDASQNRVKRRLITM